MGLAGTVSKDAFDHLCDNLHPETGKPLTPRTKTGRTVGYDFTFDGPKSVSVLYALTGDADILRVFRESVAETMREIEADAATRVRGRGRDENRPTGNLAWAEFIHFTARPVDGVPDPGSGRWSVTRAAKIGNGAGRRTRVRAPFIFLFSFLATGH